MSDKKKIRVFLDSDGVKADFLSGFLRDYGRAWEQTHIGSAWKFIRNNPTFYANLPLMPGADRGWERVKKYKPAILTGAPSAGFDDAKAAKLAWYAKYSHVFTGLSKIIVCLSKDKALHMVNPGDILIDDHQKNGDKWIAAGGNFILFKNADQAADDLDALVARLEAEGYEIEGHDD